MTRETQTTSNRQECAREQKATAKQRGAKKGTNPAKGAERARGRSPATRAQVAGAEAPGEAHADRDERQPGERDRRQNKSGPAKGAGPTHGRGGRKEAPKPTDYDTVRAGRGRAARAHPPRRQHRGTRGRVADKDDDAR